jgi:hypothetical protein
LQRGPHLMAFSSSQLRVSGRQQWSLLDFVPLNLKTREKWVDDRVLVSIASLLFATLALQHVEDGEVAGRSREGSRQ